MTATALVAALDEAKDLAARGEPAPEAVTDLVLRILTEASGTPAVLEARGAGSRGLDAGAEASGSVHRYAGALRRRPPSYGRRSSGRLVSGRQQPGLGSLSWRNVA